MSGTSWQSRIDARVLEAALGLALLVVGLSGVLIPLLGVTGPLSPVGTREVHVDGTAAAAPTVTSGHATLRGGDTAELAFTGTGLGERVLLVLPGVTGALLTAAVLAVLLRMARTLREGDVFVPRNARRLRWIALAVLLLGTVVPLLDTVTTSMLVSGTPLEPEVPMTYVFPLPYVLVTFIIVAVAEAFRRGARLRDDTAGLV